MNRMLRGFVLPLLFLVASGVQAAAVVQGFNGATLARNDDGSTAAVPLGFEVNLFGMRSSSVFVNNNGNVTFDSALAEYTPFNLLSTDRKIIAPFFADVDTRSAGNEVTYGTGSFENRPAFGVNWIDVDYYSSSTAHTRRNSFQLILVSRADRGSGDFDIVFNYDRIQWEAGTASGGSADGLGGSSARAGYAIGAGAPGSAFELGGSAVNGAFLDNSNQGLVNGSRGSSVLGRYVFEIRSAQEAQVSALTPFANGPSLAANSDASGNFVVFQSRASNLTSSDPNPGSDAYVIDTRDGVIRRFSVDNTGAPLAGDASQASISSDARLAFFVAPNVAVGELLGEPALKRLERLKTSGSGVFMRNLITSTTQRVSSGTGSGAGTQPRAAAGGGFVVFTATTTNASEGQVGQDNIYRAPLTRSGDAVTVGTPVCVSCKSVNANGSNGSDNSNGAASLPSISADGNVIAWQTAASNSLVGSSAPCAGASLIVVRNIASGVLTRASVPAGGACGTGGSRAPQLDDSGTQLVFESDQPLLAADSNNVGDIYHVALASGTLRRLSQTPGGTQANAASSAPAISGNGKVVAYVSAATNLDPATDGNGAADLHAMLLASGATQRLASTDTGQQANGASARPDLNFDGSRVVFDSVAGNLAPGAVAGREIVFQRANPAVSAVLKSATWWKSNESGWGLFIFDQGNLLAPAWFTYDTDGEPTWFLAAGAFPQADGSYTGSLFRFTGVPLAQIVGMANDPGVNVGNLVLRFSGDTALSFQYTVNGITQTKAMTRFPLGTRSISCSASPTASRAAATNYSDVWYGGSSNAGWGLFLNHVDNSLFAVWYTYDTDREPLFLVITTTRQPDGSYTGQVFRPRNGTPFSAISDAPPSSGSDQIGTATFRFTDGQNGTFNYVLGTVNQTKPIVRLQVGDTATVCESVPATR